MSRDGRLVPGLDPTCESYGCTQAAIDDYNQRQPIAAGEIVFGDLGLKYEPTDYRSRSTGTPNNDK